MKFKKKCISNGVIWITGLSGVGKTTLAKEVTKKLKLENNNVIFLDGDELREILSLDSMKNNNNTLKVRFNLSKTYARLCKNLASQDFIVVIATISLFKKIHIWNRNNIDRYFEVYIKRDIKDLISRDTKGIYKNFKTGKIKNVLGLDLKIDEPKKPHFLVTGPFDNSNSKIAEEIIEMFTKGI